MQMNIFHASLAALRPAILNRDFQHPADGWYQIEALGQHFNRAADVVQVIDQEAAASMVQRFNAEAAAGQLRHGNEMLIDHEHFSDQPDQETRAYGWLQELQTREDGIYGRIRWTATGKTAVDGGDYRFFSTEYEAKDLQAVTTDDSATGAKAPRGAAGGPRKPSGEARALPVHRMSRMRPMRLAGLTLTNMNNNRGQKPITNRSAVIPARETQDADKNVRAPNTFAVSPEPADSTNINTKTAALSRDAATVRNKTMKTVCTLLGLSAEADEASVHTAVSKLLNRGDITPDALAALRAEHQLLGETNQTLLGEQLDGLLAEHGIKDAKIINRLTPVLTPLKNREERLACLADFGFILGGKGSSASSNPGRVLNRGSGTPDSGNSLAGADDQTIARKIKNRANELKGASPKRAFDDCWNQASSEMLKS